jgi:hypothetical protein
VRLTAPRTLPDRNRAHPPSRKALSINDHEVGDGLFGVSSACRVGNFMITGEWVDSISDADAFADG